jgi:type VI secretion system protein VasD
MSGDRESATCQLIEITHQGRRGVMHDTNRPRTAVKVFLIALAGVMLTACAVAGKVADIADIPLQAVGLSAPSAPTEPPPPPIPPPRIRSVRLRVDSAADLNADNHGNGLALIARVYKLRDTTAFLQAPFDTFLKPEQEKAVFGTDLVDVHEVILTPGQQFETRETLQNESPWIGVVALFRKPAPYRWRFVFKATDVEKSGVLAGAHACALTITAPLSGNDGSGRRLDQLPPFCP